MTGSNHRKVPAVEGGNSSQPKSFGDGDQRRVHHAEGEVSVLLDQVGGAAQVGGGHLLQSPRRMDGMDLDDPDVMASAWR